jgi:hypothetical protein
MSEKKIKRRRDYKCGFWISGECARLTGCYPTIGKRSWQSARYYSVRRTVNAALMPMRGLIWGIEQTEAFVQSIK